LVFAQGPISASFFSSEEDEIRDKPRFNLTGRPQSWNPVTSLDDKKQSWHRITDYYPTLFESRLADLLAHASTQLQLSRRDLGTHSFNTELLVPPPRKQPPLIHFFTVTYQTLPSPTQVFRFLISVPHPARGRQSALESGQWGSRTTST
jgi:hypothetical protein